MAEALYAHTLKGFSPEHWELLDDHSSKVASAASRFAGDFGVAAWGEALGRYHDVGKASLDFQTYIRGAGAGADDAGIESDDPGTAKRVDHSTFGARLLAAGSPGVPGQLLAYCIAGHHTGLPNDSPSTRGTLRFRLDPAQYAIPTVAVPALGLNPFVFPLKGSPGRRNEFPFQLAFLTRMLFSCLIDADRICTEEFCDAEASAERARFAGSGDTPGAERPTLAALKAKLDESMRRKQADADDTEVNRQRAHVLSQCRDAAFLPPGFFSLNVPTGGGKTLSSLAFALDHALQHSLRRVIVAIPFTSIIEQTADVYRDALGALADAALVEHHSNLQPSRETRANQLGTENWDAPLIVTTNVQLLESLFAYRTTPCRKLHNIARSVIVLDEAQTVPVEYLLPVLAALRELVLNYGCSIVLCTATQPALEKRTDFALGLEGVRPIIREHANLFAALKRVEVQSLGKIGDDALVERLAEHPRVLCIVNTRKHAANLYERLVARSDPRTCFHLSTWMCGAHRREVLKAIRECPPEQPCRVVSTQLVEAGVDLDFPVVFRAEAGFDSIAQAAGRCNREGKLPVGYTYVFDAEHKPPQALQRAAEVARELFSRYPNPLAPEAVEAYFRLYYWQQKMLWDKHEVMKTMSFDPVDKRAVLQFRDAAERFVLIREDTLPILVPFAKEGKELWDKLSTGRIPFLPQRILQPYLVTLPRQAVEQMLKRGFVSEHESGVWLLQNQSMYGARGLDPGATWMDALIV